MMFISGLSSTALGGPTLALEGGGFRAQSAATGFVAGMLAYIGKHRAPPNLTPTLESTDLLGRFAAVSSNSGSSWFFSELAYSAPFKALVEQMAAAPNASAAAYYTEWTSKWLEATNVQPLKFNLWADAARALVSALFGTGDEDTVYLLQFFLATGHTSWDDFVDVLLHSNPNPDPNPNPNPNPLSRCCSTRRAACCRRCGSAARSPAHGPMARCGSSTLTLTLTLATDPALTLTLILPTDH